MRKTDIDIARRAALCVSLNKVSSTKIHYLYKVSANKTVCMCNITDQMTQLNLDIKYLIVTKSNYKNAVAAKLYNNVVTDLVHYNDIIINLRHEK